MRLNCEPSDTSTALKVLLAVFVIVVAIYCVYSLLGKAADARREAVPEYRAMPMPQVDNAAPSYTRTNQ